jgi:DNA-binding CsgD family transcriptional regulator
MGMIKLTMFTQDVFMRKGVEDIIELLNSELESRALCSRINFVILDDQAPFEKLMLYKGEFEREEQLVFFSDVVTTEVIFRILKMESVLVLKACTDQSSLKALLTLFVKNGVPSANKKSRSLKKLSYFEREVLYRLCCGYSPRIISLQLRIPEKKISKYKNSALIMLGILNPLLLIKLINAKNLHDIISCF